jgi:hypothetical protein
MGFQLASTSSSGRHSKVGGPSLHLVILLADDVDEGTNLHGPHNVVMDNDADDGEGWR